MRRHSHGRFTQRAELGDRVWIMFPVQANMWSMRGCDTGSTLLLQKEKTGNSVAATRRVAAKPRGRKYIFILFAYVKKQNKRRHEKRDIFFK